MLTRRRPSQARRLIERTLSRFSIRSRHGRIFRVPNGGAITVAIADDQLRAIVQGALDALAHVHGIPSSAPPVTIDCDTLAYGRVAEFRVLSDGSLEIALDAAQSMTPALDVLHEVGHYVDWAVLTPPSQMSSGSLSPEFDQWLAAVTASNACQEMHRIATTPGTVDVRLDDGTQVQLVEDPGFAQYSLQAPEVFARSYSQYIVARSGNPELGAELVHALRNHYPEQWRPEDFEPIARAIDDLLGGTP